MRKIKFAGVAAATLLAISPVATNALGNTEGVAQAAGTTSTAKGSVDSFFSGIEKLVQVISDKLNALKNQNDSKVETPTTTPAKTSTDAINGVKDVVYTNDNKPTKDMFEMFESANNAEGLKTEDLAQALLDSKAIDQATADKINADPDLEVTITIDNDENNVTKMIDNMVNNGNGQTFPVYIKVKEPNKDTLLVNRTLYFTNNSTVAVKASLLNIKYTTPVSLSVGDSVFEQTLSNSASDTKITDQNGANVSYTANPGKFYQNSSDALKRNNNTLDLGNNFNVDGATYYQPVTLTFGDNVNINEIYSQMQNSASPVVTMNGQNAYLANIDKKDSSIVFVRTIQVGAGFVNPDNNNNNENNNNNTNTENGIWVEDSTIGTVQVKNSTASLYNDDNDITNRALAANSSWATDKSRVNSKTGLKQYHVSTHEWVNASDITFTSKDGNTTNNNGSTSGLNNITDLQGYHAVKLDGPTGFVYALYSQNGTRSNRGLAGLTSWYTDKSATDSQGNTYYRVSTDEWVRASTGVTLN
jgi:hypothetical protein